MVGRLALLALVLGCGAGDKKDLPAGWEGATDLAITQSECDWDTSALPAAPLRLSRGGGLVVAIFEDARFRCRQLVCAFRVDQGGATRVLMQPCEMNPQQVPKCGACRYSVGFQLSGVVAGSLVELHQRSDRYGATSEPLPTLVASQRAP